MTDLRQVVARAIEIYPRNVDVRDFGAVGDGKTDDTAAFQAAIDFMAKLAELWPKITEHLPDAVLAAVSGAVGEDGVERATHEATIATFGMKNARDAIAKAVETAAPWIAIAARAAALEEAAKVADAEKGRADKENLTGHDEFESGKAAASENIADSIRALLPPLPGDAGDGRA